MADLEDFPAGKDRLLMNNSQDRLCYGSSVLVEFSTDVELSTANFATGTWEY